MGNISNIKGEETEKAFANWLNKAGIPFFYVGQKKTIPSSSLLKAFGAKRPDFVILVQRIGMFLVDVKGTKLYRIKNSFDIKPEDFYHYFNLEKHFSFKLFLVFYDVDFDPDHFYWVSMHRINIIKIDDSIKNKSGKSHSIFRIPLLDCTKVNINDNFQSFFHKFQSIK